MLRWIAVFFEILIVATFCLLATSVMALLTAIYHLNWPGFVQAWMDKTLAPFVTTVHKIGGYVNWDVNGQIIDHAIPITVMLVTGLFFGLLVITNAIYRFDQKIEMWIGDRRHRKFLGTAVERSGLTGAVVADLETLIPEAAALLAISTENLDRYPGLEDYMAQMAKALPRKQSLLDHPPDRYLFRFEHSGDAIAFAIQALKGFLAAQRNQRIQFDHPPVMRLAVQSYTRLSSMFDDEQFIWDMVHCAAPQSMYVTSDVKSQMQYAAQQTGFASPVQFASLGSFTNLGQQKSTDLYRLEPAGK